MSGRTADRAARVTSRVKARVAARVTVGCDIGGSTIKIVRLAGENVVDRVERPSSRDASPAQFVDALTVALRSLEADAIGVAVPGFLDARRRRIVRLSNLPRLDGLDLAARLERRLGKSTVLDADSNAGAVGEARLGAARGAERVLYVTLGTGVGAALVAGGEPVRASRHTIGQIAWLPLADDGTAGSRGRDRSVERRLCAAGIVRDFHRAGGARAARTAWAVSERARGGDPIARATFARVGSELAGVLRILVPLWQPDVVVIGGGVAGAADLFLPHLDRALVRALPAGARAHVDVRAAALAQSAGAVGAALLARDASLDARRRTS